MDAQALAHLRYEFRSSIGEALVNEDEFVDRCSQWMSKRLNGLGPWHCWVAVDKARIVGNLWLQIIEKIPNPIDEPEYHGYITNVFVQESARGRGLGSKLLTTSLEFCKEERVHQIVLWPAQGSIEFYLQHGFSEPIDILRL